MTFVLEVLDDDNDRICDEFNTKTRPLHGDAPRGVLTVEDRAQVAAHKAELVALLQAETGPAAATLTVSDALGVFPGATIVRGQRAVTAGAALRPVQHVGLAAGSDLGLGRLREVPRTLEDDSDHPAPSGDRRLEEGLEVIADEAVEDAALGAAGLIAAGTHGDRTSEGRAGLGLRSGAALPVRRRGAAERPAATPCSTTSGRSRGSERPTPRQRRAGSDRWPERWIAFQELIDGQPAPLGRRARDRGGDRRRRARDRFGSCGDTTLDLAAGRS